MHCTFFQGLFVNTRLCIKIKKDPNYDFKEAGNATQKPYFLQGKQT